MMRYTNSYPNYHGPAAQAVKPPPPLKIYAATDALRVLGLLRRAARAEDACPSNTDIAGRLELSGISKVAKLIRQLEVRGDIEVTRYQNCRVVRFPDGSHTKPPINAKVHWRDRAAAAPAQTEASAP